VPESPSPSIGFYETVYRRRDVRAEFTGAPIDASVLNRVLSAAHAAPSVGLSQPWDFLLVRNAATREQFRHHVMVERQRFAEALPEDRADRFRPIKIEGIRESTLGIVVTYDATRAGPNVLGRHTIADTGLYSTCLAIENLWLAATAEELGVGWVSFFREPFLRELLSIPDHVRPVAWLCVGPVTHLEAVPDLQRFGWRSRSPVDEAVHYERW
jgi:5,6-dimethylbenzimidazole synthase